MGDGWCMGGGWGVHPTEYTATPHPTTKPPYRVDGSIDLHTQHITIPPTGKPRHRQSAHYATCDRQAVPTCGVARHADGVLEVGDVYDLQGHEFGVPKLGVFYCEQC